VVAVIGLGGTGAYVLDFLAKKPVPEIRAFDPDVFHVHNAFRSPGRLDETELGKPKTGVYGGRYDNFRHGLKMDRKLIDSSSTADFEGVTFAFVCVDKGSARAGIFDLLISRGIPFIDVGMGLDRKRGPVNGMLRTTYYSAEHAQKLRDKGLAEMSD
jgi:tRNA A37 threonylcarbamoyladenosine dehydratase